MKMGLPVVAAHEIVGARVDAHLKIRKICEPHVTLTHLTSKVTQN